MTVSYAHVRTNHASKYAAELTRDWMKSALPVFRDHAHAAITLPFGCCEFNADKEFLDITLTADTIADTTLLEDIVSDRLDRLSQGEPFSYAWVLHHEARGTAEKHKPRTQLIENSARRSKGAISVVA